MCRNIRRLRKPVGLPPAAELDDAALQFVRKVSGFSKPSQVNQEVFDKAVAEISASTRVLLQNLIVRPAPHRHPHSPRPRTPARQRQ